MFEHIATPKTDPILLLSKEFKEDPRSDKIDLGVGVYRDETGITPIMRAVSQAEDQLLKQETTKSYQGVNGDEEFNQALQRFLLQDNAVSNRAVTLQSTGSTGALRVLADLVATTRPEATVWISDPAYVNHAPILSQAGLRVQPYPYLNRHTKAVDETALFNQLAQLGKDDVLLLHGCCHNPSGADLSLEHWQHIAQLAQQQGFLPWLDIAYQGLGDGLDEDLQGMRLLAESVPEMILAYSCSKNFGLYRDRLGAAMVLCASATQMPSVREKMGEITRALYSMPPAHGAAIVRTILASTSLTETWREELTQMRDRVHSLRQQLQHELQTKAQSNRFDYLTQHKGMFSLTGLDADILHQLKSDFGIYIVNGGRVNIAGLKSSQVTTLANALVAVGA